MDMLKAVLRYLWRFERTEVACGAAFLILGISDLAHVVESFHHAVAGGVEPTLLTRMLVTFSILATGSGTGLIARAVINSHKDVRFYRLPRDKQNEELSRMLGVSVSQVEQYRQPEAGAPLPHQEGLRTHDGNGTASGDDEDHGR